MSCGQVRGRPKRQAEYAWGRKVPLTYGLSVEYLLWAGGRARLDDPNPPGPSETVVPSHQAGNGADLGISLTPVPNAVQ